MQNFSQRTEDLRGEYKKRSRFEEATNGKVLVLQGSTTIIRGKLMVLTILFSHFLKNYLNV